MHTEAISHQDGARGHHNIFIGFWCLEQHVSKYFNQTLPFSIRLNDI